MEKKRADLEQKEAEKEAARNLEAKKVRVKKEILTRQVRLGGTKLVLKARKSDPAIDKRYMADWELKGFMPQYIEHILRGLLARVDDYYYDGIDPVDFIKDFLDDRLPCMHLLDARFYMRGDYFPSECPECGRSIQTRSYHCTPQENDYNIHCSPKRDQKQYHEEMFWRVECPNCESQMNPRRAERTYSPTDNTLIALVCPECGETWRRDLERYQEWPEKYCHRVVLQRIKEKHKKFTPLP